MYKVKKLMTADRGIAFVASEKMAGCFGLGHSGVICGGFRGLGGILNEL